eukprot:TRINITY_DN6873_c0_g1_i1.p1 TRINITY_DN6873_c0_g1~~TRINITY_DN6873_c0_g1_i1.p1  ORF type:complete len:1732 (+),score=442.60 TRINITY_DN6873_c0_g1_i1:70-5265(+)
MGGDSPVGPRGSPTFGASSGLSPRPTPPNLSCGPRATSPQQPFFEGANFASSQRGELLPPSGFANPLTPRQSQGGRSESTIESEDLITKAESCDVVSVHSAHSGGSSRARRQRSAAFRMRSLEAYEQSGFLCKPNRQKELLSRKCEQTGTLFGVSAMQGWRKTMEDQHCVQEVRTGEWCVGVFDGHAGDAVAKRIAAILPGELGSRWSHCFSSSPSEAASATREAFFAADRAALDEAGGCTGVVALLAHDRVVIANCGDARAVLCCNGHAVPLSHDHKPYLEPEKARIELSGALVEDGRVSVPCVAGRMAVSRAFGDAAFKKQRCSFRSQPISSLADVTVTMLGQQDEFLLLCCDGVWDVMSDQQAVDLVRTSLGKSKDLSAEVLESICAELCDACLAPTCPAARGTDNVTAALVVLGNRPDVVPGVTHHATDPLLMLQWENLRMRGLLSGRSFQMIPEAVCVTVPRHTPDPSLEMESPEREELRDDDRRSPDEPREDDRQSPRCAPAAFAPVRESTKSTTKDAATRVSTEHRDLPESPKQTEPTNGLSTRGHSEASLGRPVELDRATSFQYNSPGKRALATLVNAEAALDVSRSKSNCVLDHGTRNLASVSRVSVEQALTVQPDTERSPTSGQRVSIREDKVLVLSSADHLNAPVSPLMLSDGDASVLRSPSSMRNPLSTTLGGCTSATADTDRPVQEMGPWVRLWTQFWVADHHRESDLDRAVCLLPLSLSLLPFLAVLIAGSAAGGVWVSAGAQAVVLVACAALLAVGHSRGSGFAERAGNMYVAAVVALLLVADAFAGGACDVWLTCTPFLVSAQSCGSTRLWWAGASAVAVLVVLRTLDETRGASSALSDLTASDAAAAERGTAEWAVVTLASRLFSIVGGCVVSASVRQAERPSAVAALREIAAATRKFDFRSADRTTAAMPRGDLRDVMEELVGMVRLYRSWIPDALVQADNEPRSPPPRVAGSPGRDPAVMLSPVQRPILRERGSISLALPRIGSARSELSEDRRSRLSVGSASRDMFASSRRRASSVHSSNSGGDGDLRRTWEASNAWIQDDWRRPREATVLRTEIDTVSVQTDWPRALSYFVSRLEAMAQRSTATIIFVTGTFAMLSWNTYKPCPSHTDIGCRCALGFMRALPPLSRETCKSWYGVSVVHGCVTCGVTGSQQRQSFVLGTPVIHAKMLASLALQIQSRVLLADRTYEQVRSSFVGRPVDAIRDTGFDGGRAGGSVVYELLGRRGDAGLPNREATQLYVDAFVAMRNQQFSVAREKLLQTTRISAHDPQVVRLLQLNCWLSGAAEQGAWFNPKRYARVWVGWEDIEAMAKDALDKDEEALEATRTMPESSSMADEDQDEVDFLSDGRRQSMQHARLLRVAIREAEAEAHAEDLAAWGIMPGARPAAQATKTRGNVLPLRFKDHRDRVWQRAEKCLGKGAFGEVWMGMSSEGALVAIKSMRLPLLNTMKQEREEPDVPVSISARRRAARKNQSSKDSRQRQRQQQQQQIQQIEDLLREVELMQQLRHENIVGYLASAIENGFIMIVMEYLSGGSLQTVLTEFGVGKIPLTSVQKYLSDIVNGLTFLHYHLIVHRDMKPHNVLLQIEGQCKLADFGASAQLTELNATNQGVMGTPLYMAPEACRGEVCSASDIWGLGIIICQIFSGDLPYHFTSEEPFIPQVFVYRLGSTDTLVPAIPDSVPLEARDLTERCLQRNPHDRPSAEDLQNEGFLLR